MTGPSPFVRCGITYVSERRLHLIAKPLQATVRT